MIFKSELKEEDEEEDLISESGIQNNILTCSKIPDDLKLSIFARQKITQSNMLSSTVRSRFTSVYINLLPLFWARHYIVDYPRILTQM